MQLFDAKKDTITVERLVDFVFLTSQFSSDSESVAWRYYGLSNVHWSVWRIMWIVLADYIFLLPWAITCVVWVGTH